MNCQTLPIATRETLEEKIQGLTIVLMLSGFAFRKVQRCSTKYFYLYQFQILRTESMQVVFAFLLQTSVKPEKFHARPRDSDRA